MKLLLACLILISVSGRAQSPIEQIIKELRQKSNEAIKAHDTAAMAQYWLDDVQVITSRSVSLTGKAANRHAFHLEFQSKENLLYVRTPTTIEAFSSWNMASEHGTWTGTWTTKGSSVRVSGSYYAKWHRVNGNWKIRSETYLPTACDGDDYCKSFTFPESSQGIVVQNFYFPKQGKENEVMETRRHASKVREQAGLPAGRILLRISESTSQPYIVWECEYPSIKAREDDVASLDHSAEFTKVQNHMSTLLEKFDRAMWQIVK